VRRGTARAGGVNVLGRSIVWRRVDVAGDEHVLFDDTAGLRARGVAIAVDPVPYTCRYQLLTDDGWATRMFEVEAEGAGWRRQVRLERAAGRWRVTTNESGRLDKVLARAGRPGAALPGTDLPEELTGALDVDLFNSPLTNTLPLRRLRLLPADQPDATEHRITAAWVILPELTVLPSEQAYTVLGPDRVRYSSGKFSAELTVDGDGFVRHYPGLADRA
jgi:uncharacterized protein